MIRPIPIVSVSLDVELKIYRNHFYSFNLWNAAELTWWA